MLCTQGGGEDCLLRSRGSLGCSPGSSSVPQSLGPGATTRLNFQAQGGDILCHLYSNAKSRPTPGATWHLKTINVCK